MAQESGVTRDAALGPSHLAEHGFTIVRRGYDPAEVRSVLAEYEAAFQEIEDRADQMRVRLSIAEEKNAAIDDVNRAMAAVFETKERVLEKAELRARRIEATATKKARVEAETVSARVIDAAREEARRIVEAALAVATGSTEDAVLRAARVEADRLLRDARAEADRLVERARAAGGREHRSEPTNDEPVPDPVIEPQADPDPPLGFVVGNAESIGFDDRPSRYERTSAGLPSMGDNGAEVFDAIRRMRKGLADL